MTNNGSNRVYSPLIIRKKTCDRICYPHPLLEMTWYYIYTLRPSLQILRSAVLDDRTSRAGDLKSGSVFSMGSIISKRPHVFECMYTCYMCIKTQYSYDKVI